jgi:hypothetical protein
MTEFVHLFSSPVGFYRPCVFLIPTFLCKDLLRLLRLKTKKIVDAAQSWAQKIAHVWYYSHPHKGKNVNHY